MQRLLLFGQVQPFGCGHTTFKYDQNRVFTITHQGGQAARAEPRNCLSRANTRQISSPIRQDGGQSDCGLRDVLTPSHQLWRAEKRPHYRR